MKKLIFKVSTKKETEIVSLIKKINEISCRLYLDLENGIVSVENVNDSMIDDVIELVNNYYSILGVDIDNTSEEALTKKKGSVLVSPQTEDDLIVEKVKFRDETVEAEINRLMKSAYWAMYKQNAPAEMIVAYLKTAMCEIHMNFSGEETQDVVVGDVVDCIFGYHMTGELNGMHIKSIVCNMAGNMVYVVPISKEYKTIRQSNCLKMTTPNDVTYYNDVYTDGFVFFDAARYIRVERINSIIGHVNQEFLKKLLKMLPSAFNFSNESFKEEERNNVNWVDKPIQKETASNKMGVEEAVFYEEIGYAFNNLDKSKPISEQIKLFMVDIGMELSNELVMQAFENSFNIEKINYNNVICELKKLNPQLTEIEIKEKLQKSFKDWLVKYPRISQKSKRISIISLIQAFVKKLK